MGKNKKKGPKANVFKVAGAKSLKKTKAKAVNLGLKNANLQRAPILPSKWRQKPGRRRYIDYTKTQLDDCLTAVKLKMLTQRDASEFYEIPRSTIKIKLHNNTCNRPGRPMIFSEQEEDLFVSHITALLEHGLPITRCEIQMIVKDYLTTNNKSIPQFKNNIPGKDWLKSFLDRYQSIAQPIANYNKKKRALPSESTIVDFIQNVSQKTENISPENIYCFDEISFSDNPGFVNAIYRRDSKNPECFIDSAKASFSVMFCGNAVGETIPPFIVFKSEQLPSIWTKNGPDGARYNCTTSGWIDIVTFEDWFLRHLLPTFNTKNGPKVIIGDHLSSHISKKVLIECEEKDINIICLPPNTTQILHPLDVAFFQPLEYRWRPLLIDWQFSQTTKTPFIPKSELSNLLKKALDTLTEKKQNIILGFRRTGIYPLSIQKPLARFSTLDFKMAKKRKQNDISAKGTANTSAVTVEPEDFVQTESKNNIDQFELNTNISSDDIYLIVVDGDDVFQIPIQKSQTYKNQLKITAGDHVIVTRGARYYPGEVIITCEVGGFVRCMKKRKMFWRWPAISDIQLFHWESIVCRINVPQLVKSDCYFIPEMDCVF